MKTPKKKTILIAAAAVVVLAATPALWATVERQAENREMMHKLNRTVLSVLLPVHL